MKIIIKNKSNLFINNYKTFYPKHKIKTNNKKNVVNNYLFISRYKNNLLLFKSCYYNHFTFNNLVANQINFYILLNNNNHYFIVKSTHFEYVYNLTYKIILNIIVKRRVKIIFANKFIAYINLFVCLTKRFVNKT